MEENLVTRTEKHSRHTRNERTTWESNSKNRWINKVKHKKNSPRYTSILQQIQGSPHK